MIFVKLLYLFDNQTNNFGFVENINILNFVYTNVGCYCFGTSKPLKNILNKYDKTNDNLSE